MYICICVYVYAYSLLCLVSGGAPRTRSPTPLRVGLVWRPACPRGRCSASRASGRAAAVGSVCVCVYHMSYVMCHIQRE